jgi:formylglycine-generating enzyme required for sulfatase activity
VTVGYAHPVEQVDWEMCDRLLRRHGLVVPTEAQWEYGCRAGTDTPWFPGDCPEDLAGFANVLDRTGWRVMPEVGGYGESFDDRFVEIAPVGSFQPNDFGLFDVHGNVWEWCRDQFESYQHPVAAGDGLRQPEGNLGRVVRGGSFRNHASIARSAFREALALAFHSLDVGVRPGRILLP